MLLKLSASVAVISSTIVNRMFPGMLLLADSTGINDCVLVDPKLHSVVSSCNKSVHE